MMLVGLLLASIWVTIAYDKTSATKFLGIVLVIGFGLRFATKYFAGRREKPSLLRQAIMDQLPPEALARPRIMVATAGSATLADTACEIAAHDDSALVVAFVREVALNYKMEAAVRTTLDTDPAAQALYVDYLEAGHKYGVPIIPAYDSGMNAAETIAELAALNGASKLIIGTSRRGALHQLIKGSFQKKIEDLLGDDVPVQVVAPR
jgi:nucleotide-binding universal stress UspA family protein